jgi:hypothetical protein
MRASPSFFSSSNGLAAVSGAEAETGGVCVWEIQVDTSTALARAKALPIRVEFKGHLVWEESRGGWQVCRERRAGENLHSSVEESIAGVRSA